MSNDPLIVPVSAQCAVFLRACLCGASLALFYDFFRILRRVFRCPAGLVAVQDLFCCAVFCLGSFLFLLSECEGKLRWFALAGQVLGAVLYWVAAGSGGWCPAAGVAVLGEDVSVPLRIADEAFAADGTPFFLAGR